ncbi:MAG: hypothetical protein E7293_04910 [Lachnospiraceae bacterium]|nr:hypothetical protein [Lachnospiraceae bacterium]
MEKMFQMLDATRMHILVVGAALVFCLFAGLGFGLLYRKGRLWKEICRTIEASFRDGSRPGYQKLHRWLKAVGAEYVVKGFEDPLRFLTINAILVITSVIVFGILSNFFVGIVVATALVATEIFMLVVIDKKSNRDMLDDISFLYDATAIQLSCNIYVIRAVSNCLIYIRTKRLKEALMELCGNLALGGDVGEATRDLSEKFHNEYLDTFCNVIVQITTETGQVGKLIDDMSQQLLILKETDFAGRKKSTENKLQCCIIGIFITFTGLIFYLCIVSMSGSANTLF